MRGRRERVVTARRGRLGVRLRDRGAGVGGVQAPDDRVASQGELTRTDPAQGGDRIGVSALEQHRHDPPIPSGYMTCQFLEGVGQQPREDPLHVQDAFDELA
jgi:hypothetical protein